VIRETDDPEVVVAEITHHGWSKASNAPYRITALGVIRVRDGQILQYDDYMNPIALATALGRATDLAAALTNHLSGGVDAPLAPSQVASTPEGAGARGGGLLLFGGGSAGCARRGAR
jgi:hypothetical protein